MQKPSSSGADAWQLHSAAPPGIERDVGFLAPQETGFQRASAPSDGWDTTRKESSKQSELPGRGTSLAAQSAANIAERKGCSDGLRSEASEAVRRPEAERRTGAAS